MSNEKLVELKPCPFCGKQPASRFFGDEDGGYWGIDCCKAAAHDDDEASAAKAWNTRADALSATPAPELVESIISFRDTDAFEEFADRLAGGELSLNGLWKAAVSQAFLRERISSLTQLPDARRLGMEEALKEALEPFANVGRLIDGAFGPALFASDDGAFQGGCAWLENGEKRFLTWGDFRRAEAAIREAAKEAGQK